VSGVLHVQTRHTSVTDT